MHFKCFAYSTVAAAVLGLSATASASAINVNFDTPAGQAPSGTVSYGGGGGALMGKDISAANVGGVATPKNAGKSLSCSGCTINFKTGNLKSHSSGAWQFTGGEIHVNGTAKDGNTTVASGELFHGDLAQASVHKTAGNAFNAQLSGMDDFNTDLADYFGIDNADKFKLNSTDISRGKASFGSDGSFSSNGLSRANVSAQPSAVPEPSELGIFGLGAALVLAGIGFRRKTGLKNVG